MAHEYTSWAYAQQIEQPLAKFVLVCLADAADSSGRSFPGQRRLSDMTGMGVRTLRRHLERLEELGYLRREERRRKDGTRTSDEYQLPHKDTTGQIGRLFTTGQTGRLPEHASSPDQELVNPPAATGQIGRLSAPRSTGQIRQGHRPNWPLDTKPTSDPSCTTQTPAYQPAKLAGHEPLTTREPPPLPLNDSVTEEEEAENLDLNPSQAADYALGPTRGQTDSHLPTFYPEIFKNLITFTRLHTKRPSDAQFLAWSRSLYTDATSHGQETVLEALQVTIDNFPSLTFPFAFYRACIEKARASPTNDPTPAQALDPTTINQLINQAKEGTLT